MDRIRNHRVVVALGLGVAFLAALGIVKQFVLDTAPWLLGDAGGWILVGVAAIAVALTVHYALLYDKYRRAARKLMWRYIIDVQDEQVGKPGRGLGQSEGVKRGEESADRYHGDKMYQSLGLPPEDEYR